MVLYGGMETFSNVLAAGALGIGRLRMRRLPPMALWGLHDKARELAVRC